MEFADLWARHKTVYDFPNESGIPIKLRHIKRREADEVYETLTKENPEMQKLIERFTTLKKIKDMYEGQKETAFTEQDEKDLTDLASKLGALGERLSYCCFVEPKITNKEELDVLADELTKSEWEYLQKILIVLSSVMKLSDKELALINLAKTYNIPLSESLTVENMTVEQQAAIVQAAKHEGEDLSKLLKGMQK